MGLEANEKVLVSWVTNDGKQNWTISQLDATDYFTLKNQATGLLLFSNKENKPTNGPPPIPDSNYLPNDVVLISKILYLSLSLFPQLHCGDSMAPFWRTK